MRNRLLNKLCICGEPYKVGERPCHGPRSPFVSYRARCQFAVETMEDMSAPAKVQVMRLERMLREDDHEN